MDIGKTGVGVVKLHPLSAKNNFPNLALLLTKKFVHKITGFLNNNNKFFSFYHYVLTYYSSRTSTLNHPHVKEKAASF